ncbi:Protein of uncharacterised function (DUF552) [Slackia heliotrinireducens]|uniref:Uncharacterized conserved protein n=1 Tax=Slackia heliotrinireducens (strain ATCC 29202 / DSM 20476 / NCTC 11029 / RHS 1) TaxID=471855 RepID=C7N4V4_SLAHD|nr:cell division protein SepF [Slackia heliotrinireducens]ACV21939.1 uncharacterized conserved protein [Slackia heliotrinireducens DSM 20476]VEG99776.1 Protein of uncharacterised function (DUF552) [Slackia heliotrinireducens]
MPFQLPSFDGLKDRIGIGGQQESSSRRSRRAYDDEPEDDYGYEDYGEYGYDDDADYAQEGYVAPSATTSSMPRLVTAGDIRAHRATASTDSDSRVSSREAYRSYGSSDTSGTDNRSAGLQSLFTPSEGSDTYAARRMSRVLTIVEPKTYEDAERVANGLKSGDMVVLALRDTDETLSKRILDFSFGAASVLGAQVDCVASRVYTLAAGEGLTADETTRLRMQGLM